MDWFHVEIQSGEPIMYGPHRITLRSLIAWLHIPIPWASYSVYLNRPIAVEVQTSDQPMRRQLIINPTRLAVVSAYLLALICSLIIWRVSNVRK
jgi:hypothetical protein